MTRAVALDVLGLALIVTALALWLVPLAVAAAGLGVLALNWAHGDAA